MQHRFSYARVAAVSFLAALGACNSLAPIGTGRSFERLPPLPAPQPAFERPAADEAPPPEPMPVLGGQGYTRFSAGSFMPDGDIDALDDGFYAQVAFGSDLMPLLAIEASVGYLSADGDFNSELWAIPVLLNGRLQVPILIFELYGGIGLGGMYADYQVGPLDDDDFVLAGTAFAGAEVGLGKLAVGAEYRYLTTEEIDTPLGEFTIEGHSVLLSLTLPF